MLDDRDPISSVPEPPNSAKYGVTGDDYAVWCEKLRVAMGGLFNDFMTLLDYGCGNGRFCNYVSRRLPSFRYYGVEPFSQWGKNSIADATQWFGFDKRVSFGFTDSDFETRAIGASNVVLLGSIFTHLPFDSFVCLMNKFLPILRRGGRCVYSVFIEDAPRLDGDPGFYDVANCYPRSFLTRDQINNYAKNNGIVLHDQDEFMAGPDKHIIMCAETIR